LLNTLGSVGQGLEQFQPFGEVTNSLNISRALSGSLTGILPIGKGLLDKARLRVVRCEQLRLGFLCVQKTFFQHLTDPLVKLLAAALEERLVSGVLHERVLE
jgi:hypothetical protein